MTWIEKYQKYDSRRLMENEKIILWEKYLQHGMNVLLIEN